MGIVWRSYPTDTEAAGACAASIAAALEEALSGRQFATLAVSGGTTPKLLFERLAASPVAWERVHIFWVDERPVPPSDPQSNYRLAKEHFLLPAHISPQNQHRILAENTPETAARRYADEIKEFFGLSEGEMPRLDVVHRGVGPDAHTASLFPREPLIQDRQGIAAAVYVPKMAQWRITLLPGVLLAAGHTVVLAAGEDKAEAVRAVFHEPYNPATYPAQLGHDRQTEWFLDKAAARLLD